MIMIIFDKVFVLDRLVALQDAKYSAMLQLALPPL